MINLEEQKILPGSQGEHEMQEAWGTQTQAKSFYDRQMLDYLAPLMQDFIVKQEMVFISTSDKHGECDCSLRTGEAGFIVIIDEHRLAYPDYKGNGVLASLGNVSENPHIGMLFIDFFEDKVGLHVNGKVKIIDDDMMQSLLGKESASFNLGKKTQFWTLVEVQEAYIHCSKNIPTLQKSTEDSEKIYPIDYFELQR